MARLFWLLRVTLRAIWYPTALGVTAAVTGQDGRVLLVRHSYTGGWQLPGGSVERGETLESAILRELAEEVGLSGGAAQFRSIHLRAAGWAGNAISFFRITGAAVNFRPNWEIREIIWADPAAPPPGATPATLRRLAELQGAPASPHW
jgi:8-oxo-dGTP pyrophosphatase MutT (NUDIX family)